MAIINGRGRVGIRPTSGSGTPSYDSDAQAFFTANSTLTDVTQKNAINQFYIDIKSYSLLDKFKAFYFLFLGDATKNSYNGKNPSAYNLTFSSGWIHSTSGATPNGTSAYANTSFNPIVESLPLNDNHLSIYSRTNLNKVSVDIGTYQNFLLISNYSSGTFVYNASAVYSYPGTNNISLGYFLTSRLSSTRSNVYKNGAKLSYATNDASTSYDNKSIYISAAGNGGGTPQWYSSRQLTFASIGNGLTDTQNTNLYTCVQTLMTTLGINV
jgi:hypothetical protein